MEGARHGVRVNVVVPGPGADPGDRRRTMPTRPKPPRARPTRFRWGRGASARRTGVMRSHFCCRTLPAISPGSRCRSTAARPRNCTCPALIAPWGTTRGKTRSGALDSDRPPDHRRPAPRWPRAEHRDRRRTGPVGQSGRHAHPRDGRRGHDARGRGGRFSRAWLSHARPDPAASPRAAHPLDIAA